MRLGRVVVVGGFPRGTVRRGRREESVLVDDLGGRGSLGLAAPLVFHSAALRDDGVVLDGLLVGLQAAKLCM